MSLADQRAGYDSPKVVTFRVGAGALVRRVRLECCGGGPYRLIVSRDLPHAPLPRYGLAAAVLLWKRDCGLSRSLRRA